MKCISCKEEGVKAFIHIQMYVDADDNNHLTKKVINKRSTEIWSQSHDKTSWVCPHCGHIWGYLTSLTGYSKK